jgi:hypothetical protein
MIGDQFSTEETGIGGQYGGGGGVGGGGSILGSVYSSLGGGGQPSHVSSSYYRGSGRTAARGLAQAQMALTGAQIRQAQQAANLNAAVIFSHVDPRTPHATVQTNQPPSVAKLVVQAAEVGLQAFEAHAAGRRANVLAKRERQIQQKIAHEQARAAVPTYQQIALTGLNMGPPISGATYY